MVHNNHTGGDGIVGRERELQELSAGILDAVGGTGGLILVRGEPGIGKSRLVEAAAEVAKKHDVTVLWGRCWEVGGAPAFWPWIQVLRPLVRELQQQEFSVLPGASALGQLLPELADSFPGNDSAAQLEPEQATFQMMDAVAGVFRAAARRNPVAIVLEDLHAADPASITLLDFLARQIRPEPVLLIGTSRETNVRGGGGDGLVRIARQARSTITLGSMTLAEVRECVRGSTGVEPEDALVAAIHEASEGNPLYAVEIAGLMAARGRLGGAGDLADIGIPDTIRAVIKERAGSIAPESHDLLKTASVVGREFTASDLVDLLDGDVNEIQRLLVEPCRVRILEERGGGEYRFAHVLNCEVLRSTLDVERRSELHLRWADLIVARHADHHRVPWVEVAHHLTAAGPAARARALDAFIEAARQAREQLAFDDAAEHFERALDLWDRSRETDPLAFGGLLIDRAEALLKAGRVEEGRAVCREAIDEARRLSDGAMLARAALVYGGVFVYGDVNRQLIGLLREALQAQEEGDETIRARLQARLAAALQPSENPEEVFQLARDAITMARETGDRRVLLDAIRSGCSALMDLGDPRERIALNREHVALAEELGRPFDAFRGHMRIVIDGVELGEPTAVETAIEACDLLARTSCLPHHQWPVASFRGLRATMVGDFEEAAKWIERAEMQSVRVGDPNARRSIALQKLALVRAQESFDEMVTLHQTIADATRDSTFTSFFASLVGASNLARMERPDEIPPGVIDRGAEVALTYSDPSAMCLVAEVAAASGLAKISEKTRGQLLSRRPYWVGWGLFGMAVEGPVSRIHALLASSLGDNEDADRDFETALEQCRTHGALPMVSRTAFEFARHLKRTGGSGSRARISELLEEAVEVATRLGQSGLLDLIRSASDSPAGDSSAASGVPEVGFFSLLRDGELWLCRCEGAEFHLKDTKGTRMLARLLDEPGREIHVLELVEAPAEDTAIDAGDGGEMLDETAKRQYQRRVEELRAEIEEAQEWNDTGREARAREEMEAIAAELSRAFGLGGRERRSGRAAERARVNVQRRIRDTLKRIEGQCPTAGKHLEWALKTGMYCIYDPS